METRKVNDQQSLFDIALQSSGSVEGIMELALSNGLSNTETLQTGRLLNSEPTLYNQQVHGEYQLKGIIPATALTAGSTGGDLLLEGIDYWYLSEYVVQ